MTVGLHEGFSDPLETSILAVLIFLFWALLSGVTGLKLFGLVYLAAK